MLPLAASVFDLDDLDALKVEHDENEQRKEPTVSEKVALAQAIAERLHGRNKRPEKHGNISTLNDQGATRDIAAAKAGLGSGKTLEVAQKVVEHGAPELVEAMDARLRCSTITTTAGKVDDFRPMPSWWTWFRCMAARCRWRCSWWGLEPVRWYENPVPVATWWLHDTRARKKHLGISALSA